MKNITALLHSVQKIHQQLSKLVIESSVLLSWMMLEVGGSYAPKLCIQHPGALTSSHAEPINAIRREHKPLVFDADDHCTLLGWAKTTGHNY